MEIQIRIKSGNEYFCVLMLVCLSNTIIVKSKNKTKTCKRSFHIKHVEITNLGSRVIDLKPWKLRICNF